MNIARRDLLKYAAAGASLLPAGLANAAPCPARNDDVWFINTEGVPNGILSPAHSRCFSALRLGANRQWQHSTADDFFAASGDGRITIFFVHGHRVNVKWAFTSGWGVYQALMAGSSALPPIRFVIWKWPSEGHGRPVVDARKKAIVADHTAYKLAWFMGHIPPSTPLTMTGFSFGPRVISGALHLTAGGSQMGYTVRSPYQSLVRNVFWVPALNNDWLVAGHRHGRAIYATDAMLNLYNCCDPILKRYPRLDHGQSDALGYTGMPASWLGAYAGRYRQRNMCKQVNFLHLTRNYSGNSLAMALSRPYALWQAV